MSATTSTQATDVNNAGTDFITLFRTHNYDWANTVDSDGSLRQVNWLKTDGTSVCPTGFRVPNIAELKAELFDVGSAQIQNREDAFNSFFKFPSAGYRHSASGSLANQGSWGNVWASSVNGFESRSIYFGSDDAGPYEDPRAFGFIVRCLRD